MSTYNSDVNPMKNNYTDPDIATIDRTVAKLSQVLSKPRGGLNPVFAGLRSAVPIKGLRLDYRQPVGTYQLEAIIKELPKPVQAKVKLVGAGIKADKPDPDLADILHTLKHMDRSVNIVAFFEKHDRDVENLTLALLALRILVIDDAGHHSINPTSLMLRYLNIDEFYSEIE